MPAHVHIKGLNGLRFFAAFIVLVAHIEQSKSILKINTFYDDYRQLAFCSGLAVTFFFVLSGFLISYLLLNEVKVEGTVHVQKFYIRRMLRIWPLYYFVLCIAVVVYLSQHCYVWPSTARMSIILDVLLLSNVALVHYGPLPLLIQVWSIGVEEQFYLFWPVFVKKLHTNFVNCCLGFISVFLVIKLILYFLITHTLTHDHALYPVFSSGYELMQLTRFDNMAIGGLLGWYYFRQEKRMLLPLGITLLLFFVYILLILNVQRFGALTDTLYALICCHIIYTAISDVTLVKILDWPVLNELGKVSYGIYMYHSFITGMAVCIFRYVADPYRNITIYSTGILATIGVSLLSYHLFEKKLLKIKSRYQVIKSDV